MIFAHQESAHFGCASARPLRPFSDRHSTFHHSLCLVLFRQLQVLPSHHFFADRFVCGFSSATCSITYHAWPEASQRWLDRTVQIVQACCSCAHTPTPFGLGGATHPQTLRQSHAHRSEEHTSELQSPKDLVCRLLLE